MEKFRWMIWYRKNRKLSEVALKRDWANSLWIETENELTSRETKNVSLENIEVDIQLEWLVVIPTGFVLLTILERQLYFLVRSWNSEFAWCGWWLGGILLKLQENKRRRNRIELEPNPKNRSMNKRRCRWKSLGEWLDKGKIENWANSLWDETERIRS